MSRIEIYDVAHEERWYVFLDAGYYSVKRDTEVELDELKILEDHDTPFYLDFHHAADVVEAHLSALERQIIKSRQRIAKERAQCIGLSTTATPAKD